MPNDPNYTFPDPDKLAGIQKKHREGYLRFMLLLVIKSEKIP